MGQTEPLTLALETGIGSGSIALLRGKTVLDWNDGRAARANDVLAAVHSILRDSVSAFQDLDLLAVSVGPGSYTGLRIGIATVLGLSRALQVPAVGVPVIRAILNSTATAALRAAVVPIGAGRFVVERFAAIESGPYAIALDELISEIRAAPDVCFLIPGTEKNPQLADLRAAGLPNVQVVEESVAVLVGRYAADNRSRELEPIYL